MLTQQIESFHGFSFIEKIKLLVSIPIKKLVNGGVENLIKTRGVLYRIIQRGGSVKNLGRYIEISFPSVLSKKDTKFLLRKKTTDVSIFSEILLQNGGDYKLIPAIVEKNHIVVRNIVDAGANIGCASIFFRQLYPEARMVCIEPDNGNFEMLQKNISLNKDQYTIPVQKAFWINNDELNFGVGIRGIREKELSFGLTEKGETKVKGFTFSDCLNLLSTDMVDLLKIDIEGAEKALIENKENFLRLLNHTRVLAIELHHEVVNLLDFIDLIKEAGFDYLQHGEITICWRK